MTNMQPGERRKSDRKEKRRRRRETGSEDGSL
jgi:hypothetical protein